MSADRRDEPGTSGSGTRAGDSPQAREASGVGDPPRAGEASGVGDPPQTGDVFRAGDFPRADEAPLYHRLLQVAIVMAFLSLVALGVQAYRVPDADNAPAPFSCSTASSLSPVP